MNKAYRNQAEARTFITGNNESDGSSVDIHYSTIAALLYLPLYSNGEMPVIFLNTSLKAFVSE